MFTSLIDRGIIYLFVGFCFVCVFCFLFVEECCSRVVEKSRTMSAEGGRSSNTRNAVHELTRQFGREPTNSPVSGPLANLIHQKSLPKILSHIAKTPPVATPPDVENVNHSFIPTGNSGIVKPFPADPDDTKTQEVMVDQTSASESESDDSPPNPVTSIAQIRPTLRQSVQPSKIQSSDYVIGLDQLQEQVRRLALRRGFTLNIMVVGKSRCHHHPSHFFLEWVRLDLTSFLPPLKAAVGWASRRSSTLYSALLFFLVHAPPRDRNLPKQQKYVQRKQVCGFKLFVASLLLTVLFNPPHVLYCFFFVFVFSF